MSTPQLFLLFLHFILFIPTSITLHSGKADFKPMLKKNTKKKKSLVPLLGLLLRGVEKPACSPQKDEETDVLLVAV